MVPKKMHFSFYEKVLEDILIFNVFRRSLYSNKMPTYTLKWTDSVFLDTRVSSFLLSVLINHEMRMEK